MDMAQSLNGVNQDHLDCMFKEVLGILKQAVVIPISSLRNHNLHCLSFHTKRTSKLNVSDPATHLFFGIPFIFRFLIHVYRSFS